MDPFILELLARMRCASPRATAEGIEARCGYPDCPSKRWAFRVNTTTNWGHWVCHGCHRHGDAIDLAQEGLGLTFGEAKKVVADRVLTRFVLDKVAPIVTVTEPLGLKDWVPYRRTWSIYVESRGYLPEHVAEYRIGYDERMRQVVAPSFDAKGRKVVGISRRRTGPGEPFIHEPFPDKSAYLYGMDVALATKRSRVYVVEGQFDVLGMRQATDDAVVATYGSYLSDRQANLLVSHFSDIVLAYDNDVAGVKGTRSAIQSLRRNGSTELHVLSYNASDPGDFPKMDQPPQFSYVAPAAWLVRNFHNGVPTKW